MQAVQAIRNHFPQSERMERPQLRAKLTELLARVFGCWHMDLSRPFTVEGETCRVCLGCGARRQFNLERWEMQGPFYYQSPALSQERPKASAQISARPSAVVVRLVA